MDGEKDPLFSRRRFIQRFLKKISKHFIKAERSYRERGFYVNSWGRAKIEKLEIVSECESSGTIFMYYRAEFFS